MAAEGQPNILIYKKEDYDQNMKRMRDGALSKAEKQPKITSFFNGGNTDRVYWVPEHGCRQLNKPRRIEDHICRKVFTTREELTRALKITRTRDDLDRCEEYQQYRKGVDLSQIVLGINDEERKKTSYEYVLGVKDYMHQDRAKTFKKSLRAPFYSRIMELMAVCARQMVKPELVREMLWKHTNLCQYHIAGACPHFLCSYSHDDIYHNMLADYVDAINLKIPDRKNNVDMPYAVQDGPRWKKIIDLAFQYHTGLPCKNI